MPSKFARGEQHGQQSHMDGRRCRGPGRGQRERKLRSLARSRDNWVPMLSQGQDCDNERWYGNKISFKKIVHRWQERFFPFLDIHCA